MQNIHLPFSFVDEHKIFKKYFSMTLVYIIKGCVKIALFFVFVIDQVWIERCSTIIYIIRVSCLYTDFSNRLFSIVFDY